MPAKKKAPKGGTCSQCGCTDARACSGGCGWTDGAHTLCTMCLDTNRVADAIRMRPAGYSLGEWLTLLMPEGTWADQGSDAGAGIEKAAKARAAVAR